MSANDTLPSPLFNAVTIAEYPSIILSLIYASIMFVLGLVSTSYFIYKTPLSNRSMSEWNALVMIILSLIVSAAIVAQYTTKYDLEMWTIGYITFGITSYILVYLVLDFLAIFHSIVPVRWFRKDHVMYYKIGFAVLDIGLIFSKYLPILNSEAGLGTQHSRITLFIWCVTVVSFIMYITLLLIHSIKQNLLRTSTSAQTEQLDVNNFARVLIYQLIGIACIMFGALVLNCLSVFAFSLTTIDGAIGYAVCLIVDSSLMPPITVVIWFVLKGIVKLQTRRLSMRRKLSRNARKQSITSNFLGVGGASSPVHAETRRPSVAAARAESRRPSVATFCAGSRIPSEKAMNRVPTVNIQEEN